MVDPIDENYSETPDKFQENISEPSSTENLQEQEDLKDEYEFFRLLVKRNILKLTSITGRRLGVSTIIKLYTY